MASSSLSSALTTHFISQLPPNVQQGVFSLQRDLSTYWPYILGVTLVYFIYTSFRVPAELAHLPRVPVIPTLISYAKGEVEDARIKRLILPFANEKGESVVVIYALGRWIVHVLDAKVHSSQFSRVPVLTITT
jgi:hypothetical protein